MRRRDLFGLTLLVIATPSLPKRTYLIREYRRRVFGEVFYYCELSEYDARFRHFVWSFIGVGQTEDEAREIVMDEKKPLDHTG